MISLTAKAAKRVKALAQKQGRAEACLRVKVVPGGCSGLSYAFEVEGAPSPGDLVSETEGAKALVDPKSDLFINGSVVDYVETLMKSGFEIKNPKAVSSCSCGSSFNTEELAKEETSFSV